MKLIALVLVGLGILALVYGGITYNRDRTVLEMGPITATVSEKKTIPIGPVLGVISILGGVALLVVARRNQGLV